MSADSRSSGAREQRTGRSLLGNIMFGAGLILVFAAMVLGGFAGVALLLELADSSFLSSVVPEDGRNAVVVGGIAFGAITGAFVPALLIGMVHGTEEKPRVRPDAAARNLLAVLVFDVFVVLLAFVLSQVGWILPGRVTSVVSVIVIGLSWIPLALAPWEKLGLGNVFGSRLSRQSD
ncbi:hypothetical protein [Streptomyces cupreus]|uniref:Uncharacterized protein n=1 Tax=Streptomyces cupreus TaxID=2759956 RepID=A0A7X1JFU8_9ACTN|nr:hypothetical protein [Streptomyces cupreus]MBC2907257.1 hypothetical protein [Streptomyces cupreus]